MSVHPRSSDDCGVTWKSLPLPTGLPGLPTAIAAHPTDTQVLHLAARTTHYSTRNGGETWTQRSFSGPITAVAADTTTVALVTLTSRSMFAPPITELHWSDDGGETFPMVEELPFAPFPIVQFAFQPDLPGVILGLAADGRGQRSTDGGRSWQPLATSFAPGQVAMQMVAGAGGVVHLALPTPFEAFAGKLTANGEVTYLTYLGGRFAGATPGLTMTPNGQVVITGQMDGSMDFPGQILRGTQQPVSAGLRAAHDGHRYLRDRLRARRTAAVCRGSGRRRSRYLNLGGRGNRVNDTTAGPDPFPGLPGSPCLGT